MSDPNIIQSNDLRNPYLTVLNGQVAGGTTAAQLPDVSAKMVILKALPDNGGYVAVGGSGVTLSAAGTVTNTTTGISLGAGDSLGPIPVSNLNKLYRICTNATDGLAYTVFN